MQTDEEFYGQLERRRQEVGGGMLEAIIDRHESVRENLAGVLNQDLDYLIEIAEAAQRIAFGVDLAPDHVVITLERALRWPKSTDLKGNKA